jgi:uncharacterized protein YceK
MKILVPTAALLLTGCNSVMTLTILSINKEAISPTLTPAAQCAALVAHGVVVNAGNVSLQQAQQICEAVLTEEQNKKNDLRKLH